MKLTKAQEKRFDEKLGVVELEGVEVFVEYVKDDDGNIIGSDLPDVKQHLADELERQKKEIIEELEKMKEKLDVNDTDIMVNEFRNQTLDQAIKTINEK